MKQSRKANDYLPGYTGTENWYKTIVPGITYTDGVYALCETYKCWWFLDIVVSYQCEKKFREEEFQVWKLIKKGEKFNTAIAAMVICEDGNDNEITRQEIPYTDFELDEAVVWLSHGVIMLPSEY